MKFIIGCEDTLFIHAQQRKWNKTLRSNQTKEPPDESQIHLPNIKSFMWFGYPSLIRKQLNFQLFYRVMENCGTVEDKI